MLKNLFLFMLGVILFVSLSASPEKALAASKMSMLDYGSGVVYYGETSNGKPHGYGTMSWGYSKSYKGDWVEGKRSGEGVYKSVTKDNEQITTVKYEGSWKNDKKEGQGTLLTTDITVQGEMMGESLQIGNFAKDKWISGYQVEHFLMADPPYNFTYKDPNKTIRVMGGAEGILTGLKEGYFFAFTYQKGKIYKDVGVGDEFDQKQFAAFIKTIEKEIKPVIDRFEKLARSL
ncbi:hypothetical protein [Paenibacillus hubeiensis]|uniref:hypothetical protein n=1 Tax=Paenibacillus hubeiensis TaxID=3077330 RepID=UPI0031BB313B